MASRVNKIVALAMSNSHVWKHVANTHILLTHTFPVTMSNRTNSSSVEHTIENTEIILGRYNILKNFSLQFDLVASCGHRTAGVFCRMQNVERAIWSAVSV